MTQLLKETTEYVLERLTVSGQAAVHKFLRQPAAENRRELAREIAAAQALSGVEGFPRFLTATESGYQREFIAGQDLKNWRPADFDELLSVAVPLARLLSKAHARGVVLGDVKPANVVRSESGEVHLVDLSLAATTTDLTGLSGGSPAYMAPELFYGGTPTPLSDFYALGITLYEWTAGRLPFSKPDFDALARAHWLEEPANPALDTVFPQDWGVLVLRFLNKAPAERFTDAASFIRAVNRRFGKVLQADAPTEDLKRILSDFERARDARAGMLRAAEAILARPKRSAHDVELAARLLTKAGDEARLLQIADELPELVALSLQANLDMKRGRLAEARRKAESLLARGESKAANILGTCAYHQGHYAEAESCFQSLIAHYRAQNALAELVPVLNNLAHVRMVQDRDDDAGDLYAQSLALARVLGDPRQEALALSSQGYLFHRQGCWGKALGAYDLAVTTYRFLGADSFVRNNLINVAGINLALGFKGAGDEAVAELAQASAGDDYLSGHVFLLQGDAARRDGRIREAVALFEQAVAAFTRSGHDAFREAAVLARTRAELFAGKRRHGEDSDLSENARAKLALLPDLVALLNDGSVPGDRLKQLATLAADLTSSLLDPDDRLEILRRLHAAARRDGDGARVEALAWQFREASERTFAGLDEERRRLCEARFALEKSETREMQFSRALIELSTGLIGELDAEELCRAILDKLVESTRSERGFILIKEDGRARLAVSRNFAKKDLQEGERQISWSLANRVLDSAKAVLTLDAIHDQRFDLTESVHRLKLRTIICLPFVYRGEVLGAIYLDSRAAPSHQNADLLRALEPFAAQLAVALFNARLFGRTRKDLDRTSRELQKFKKAERVRGAARDLIFASEAMAHIISLTERVGKTSLPLLITGESGVGKERVAQLAHESSPRKDKPFISVNCGAIPDNLLESELFGYRKGAFTGADRDKKGLFEAAHQGSIFLDEIGEMPLGMQVKLLRVLQEKEVTPLGSERPVKVDVRIIAATNRGLSDEIRKKRFREDLYYRLQVAEISVPSLRERKEDIPPLAHFFLKRVIEKESLPPRRLGAGALKRLMAYDWPGNVRELENAIYKLAVFSDEALIEDVGLVFAGKTGGVAEAGTALVISDEISLAEAKKVFERERVLAALKACQGNVSHAAKRLQVARTRLSLLIREHGIDKESLLNLKRHNL